jgi:glycosyltransferase involved in cell wall biosynthesis
LSRPVLSVVVPNYNHAACLPRCLDSVLGQSRPPDEVVVVDDASTDHSLEVLEDYARRHPQLRVYHNPENLGAVANTLEALARARGDHVFFLAADDYVLPGFFEPAMELLERYPRAGGLFCDLTQVDRRGRIIRCFTLGRQAGYLSPAELARAMAGSSFTVLGANGIFPRELLLEPGVVVAELECLVDWLFASILAFRHGICYLPGSYRHFEVRRDSFHFQAHAAIEHGRLVRLALDHLERPEFQDVRPLLRRSGNMDQLGVVGFDLLLSDPRCRRHLSLALVRRQLVPWLKFRLATALPWLRALYFRLFPSRYDL